MEVKVGIQHIQREVTVETTETAAAVEQALGEALAAGTVLKLTDEKGRVVLIPARSVGYVDLGQEHVRRVGFGTL